MRSCTGNNGYNEFLPNGQIYAHVLLNLGFHYLTYNKKSYLWADQLAFARNFQ